MARRMVQEAVAEREATGTCGDHTNISISRQEWALVPVKATFQRTTDYPRSSVRGSTAEMVRSAGSGRGWS